MWDKNIKQTIFARKMNIFFRSQPKFFDFSLSKKKLSQIAIWPKYPFQNSLILAFTEMNYFFSNKYVFIFKILSPIWGSITIIRDKYLYSEKIFKIGWDHYISMQNWMLSILIYNMTYFGPNFIKKIIPYLSTLSHQYL